MREDGNLDRSIEAALGTYSDSYASDDLAERVLARLTYEPKPRPRIPWLAWTGFAIPLAVCLLMLAYLAPRLTRPHSTSTIQSARNHIPESISPRPNVHIVSGKGKTRQAKHSVPLRHTIEVGTAAQPVPKLEVFPTPAPLTAQERALAIYVAHIPRAARKALAQSEQEQTPLTVGSIPLMQVGTIPTVQLGDLDQTTRTN